MKKIFLFMLVTLLGLSGLRAQEGEKVMVSPGKVEFQRNWFMQIQGGASYTLGENSFRNLVSPAVALNFGHQFNKVFSLRFGLSGWEGKGSWVYPRNNYKWNYLQGNVDAVVDLSAAMAGWRYDRVFNWYAFLGAGVNGSFNNDEAVALDKNPNIAFRNLWEGGKAFPVARGGMGVDFRVSNHVAINIELNANLLSDKYNSKRSNNPDWQFNGLVGLKINFGKNHKRTPAEYKYVTPTPKPQPKPEPEPEPEPQPEPEPVVVKAEPLTVNVLFVIGRSAVRDSEAEKLDGFVAYMNAHPKSKAVLTGYADKETGSSTWNYRLSEKRAAAVKAYLVDKGISADRIAVDAKGDTVQLFGTPGENRVAVCIAEE